MSLIGEDHVYSYSQLTQFAECPFSFYLERIEKVPKASSAFAEQGTLMHQILDEWARGEIAVEDMPAEFEKRYPEVVVTQFPPILAAKGYSRKNYEQCLEYLRNFDGFKDLEIIGTETKFETTLADRPFMGVVDMVARDKETGDFIVLDHKSKSLSSFRKTEEEMYRQQYVYSKYVREKYGVWPTMLMFNLFKENGARMKKHFDANEYEKTLRWARGIMEKIEAFDMFDWLQSKEKSDFFCKELCNVRHECPISIEK